MPQRTHRYWSRASTKSLTCWDGLDLPISVFVLGLAPRVRRLLILLLRLLESLLRLLESLLILLLRLLETRLLGLGFRAQHRNGAGRSPRNERNDRGARPAQPAQQNSQRNENRNGRSSSRNEQSGAGRAPRAPKAEQSGRNNRSRSNNVPTKDEDPGLVLISRRPPQQKFTSFEEYMNAHGGATAPIEDHSEEV